MVADGDREGDGDLVAEAHPQQPRGREPAGVGEPHEDRGRRDHRGRQRVLDREVREGVPAEGLDDVVEDDADCEEEAGRDAGEPQPARGLAQQLRRHRPRGSDDAGERGSELARAGAGAARARRGGERLRSRPRAARPTAGRPSTGPRPWTPRPAASRTGARLRRGSLPRVPPRPLAHRLQQEPDLAVDVGRVVHRAPHLLAQDRAEAPAQAVDRHAHASTRQAELARERRVRGVRAVAREERLEPLEPVARRRPPARSAASRGSGRGRRAPTAARRSPRASSRSTGSRRRRSSAVAASSESGARPPPRLSVFALSHSFARKCAIDARRNVRKRPASGRKSRRYPFSRKSAKYAWVMSSALAAAWPRRRTNA